MPDTFIQACTIGVGVLGLGVAWHLLDKTFRKIISNQHQIQYQLIVAQAELDKHTAALQELAELKAQSAAACPLSEDQSMLTRLLQRAALPVGGGRATLAHPGSDLHAEGEESFPWHAVDGQCVLLHGLGDARVIDELLRAGRPRRVVGVDSSPAMLENARCRIAFEEKLPSDFLLVKKEARLPLPDGSVNYIHSVSSFHESLPLEQVLTEFRRLLAPGGKVRLALHNRDSVMNHLYVGYLVQRRNGSTFSTNGCTGLCERVSAGVERSDFLAAADQHGFRVRELGNLVSPLEISILPYREEALADPAVAAEHRAFIRDLKVDERGRPVHQGRIAGYRSVFELELS